MTIKKQNNFYNAYLDNNTIYGGNFIKKLYNLFDNDEPSLNNNSYQYIYDNCSNDTEKKINLINDKVLLTYILNNIYKVNSTHDNHIYYYKNFHKNIDNYSDIFNYNNNKNNILFSFLLLYTCIIIFYINYYTTTYYDELSNSNNNNNKTTKSLKEIINNTYYNTDLTGYDESHSFSSRRPIDYVSINNLHKENIDKIIKIIVNEKEKEKEKKNNNNNKYKKLEEYLEQIEQYLKTIKKEAAEKSSKISFGINRFELKLTKSTNSLTLDNIKNIINLINKVLKNKIEIINEGSEKIIFSRININNYDILIRTIINVIISLNKYKIKEFVKQTNINNNLLNYKYKEYTIGDKYKDIEDNIKIENFIDILYNYIDFIVKNKYINDNTKINLNNLSNYALYINFNKTDNDICKLKKYKLLISDILIYIIKIFIKISYNLILKIDIINNYEKYLPPNNLYNNDINLFINFIKNNNLDNETNKVLKTIYKIYLIHYYIFNIITKKYNNIYNNIIDSNYIIKKLKENDEKDNINKYDTYKDFENFITEIKKTIQDAKKEEAKKEEEKKEEAKKEEAKKEEAKKEEEKQTKTNEINKTLDDIETNINDILAKEKDKDIQNEISNIQSLHEKIKKEKDENIKASNIKIIISLINKLKNKISKQEKYI